MASVQAHRLRVLAATGLKTSLILLTLCGAAQVFDRADEIEVTQDRGVVRFRFYTRDPERGDRVPTEATSLSVRPATSPKPIWEVVARSESSATPTITYGVLPKGFRQLVPASGSDHAPRLERGTEYIAIGMARQPAIGVFTYRGD